jgi:hypothetical protein
MAVDGPSQIRYVHYMEAVLNGQVDPYAQIQLHLSEITLMVGPKQAISPWHCSISVKCMRTIVFDSLDFGSLHTWTGKVGEVFSFRLPAMDVWGDVRIEIYKHKKLDAKSKRTLELWTCFHTNFYEHRRKVVFRKRKVDILHKDKQNFVTPPDFELTLHLQQPTLELESRWFHSIVEKIGSPAKYSRGDTILSPNGDGFFYCVHGALEVVVKSEGGHHHHHRQHGLYVTGKQDYNKVPCVGICGRGSITGADRFFLGRGGVEYRARSHTVWGYHVSRRLAGGPLQATKLDDLNVGMHIASDKLLDFYKVAHFSTCLILVLFVL